MLWQPFILRYTYDDSTKVMTWYINGPQVASFVQTTPPTGDQRIGVTARVNVPVVYSYAMVAVDYIKIWMSR